MTAKKYDTNGWYEIKNNPLSKVGVFQYLGKDIPLEGIEPHRVYNVFRPEAALNNDSTIDSFKLLPWIDDHEMLGDGFTAPESKGVAGVIGEQVFLRMAI